jgi:hypothetical protein
MLVYLFDWDFFVPLIKILYFFFNLFDWDFFVSLLFGISLDTLIITKKIKILEKLLFIKTQIYFGLR